MLKTVGLIESGEQIVENINIVKLKVKQLKLLKGPPSNLEESNIKKGVHTLGFKIEFYYIKYLYYISHI